MQTPKASEAIQRLSYVRSILRTPKASEGFPPLSTVKSLILSDSESDSDESDAELIKEVSNEGDAESNE